MSCAASVSTVMSVNLAHVYSRASWKVLDFFLKIPEPGKLLWSLKLKLNVLESTGKISLKVMLFF